MTCAEIERALPDFVDGERQAELQAHLKSCPVCAELVADLEAITAQSKLLRATDEPDPRVWQGIERELRREGLIRDPEISRPFLLPTPQRRWLSAAWLVPVAALVLGAFVFFVNRPTRVQQAKSVVTNPARHSSPEAGDPEDEKILAELESRAPRMEAAYADSLRNVNTYIQDARHAVELDPNDDDARQDLMDAYQQKAMLYDMALERSLP